MPSIRASARESDARKGDVPMRQSHREAIISKREMAPRVSSLRMILRSMSRKGS